MSHYKPYPSYKESGVEWIGKVPEHWEVVRIKRAAQISTERCNVIPNGFPYIGLEDVESGSGQYKPTAISSRQSEDSTVGMFRVGDVLYGKLRPYLRKCITAPIDGACSTEFFILKPGSVLPEWLQNWLLTPDVTQQINAGCDGAKMPRADWEHVGFIHIPMPNKMEQDSIRRALDRETARIDALIAKKTEFIELLTKKRQALITHAVTKGLNPKAKMKDSGVEWIGEVPEHWEVKPFFSLVLELNRKNTGLVEGNILSLSYGRIIPKPESKNLGLVPESYETYQIVEPGEVVFRFTDLQNDKRSLRSAQVHERGIITSAYMAVKPIEIDSSYFAWLMRAYDHLKVYYAMGGGLRQSLKFEDVRRMPVLLPSIQDQKNIIRLLEIQLRLGEQLVEKNRLSIDLLKQRRSALITAAVTGQIDLRESA